MASTPGWIGVALALAAIIAGCGDRTAARPELPAIPFVGGALRVDVVYPPAVSRIAVRDSNWLLGNVGHGGARLGINGAAVRVEPNGAFLAWLPVPVYGDDTLAVYELVAALADDTVRAIHTVRVAPAPEPLSPDRAAVDADSIFPRGVWWVREGERIPVHVRATPGSSVRLLIPGAAPLTLAERTLPESVVRGRWGFGTQQLDHAPEGPGTGLYEGTLVASTALGRGLGSGRPPVPDTDPGSDVRTAVLEVAGGRDTIRAPLGLDLGILDGAGPLVELRQAQSGGAGQGFIVGRPEPGAAAAWLWVNGVRARVTGRRNDMVRIALDAATDAWVSLDDVVWSEGAAPPAAVAVRDVRISARANGAEARIGVDVPVPYAVQMQDRRLSLTLYGAYSATQWLGSGGSGDFIERAEWEQIARDRYVLHLQLTRPAWGYQIRTSPGALVLAVREAPAIRPRRPLAGRTIVVDAGHPPGGSVGPTLLHEAQANLEIARRVARRLEREGSIVLMTRSDESSVPLQARVEAVATLDADLLVSIHNNAPAEGVNPFDDHGTSVYYFHPFAFDLAGALHRSLLRTLGLEDLGFGRANLAIVQPTWFPSVLTEGAFMTIPQHEAALRNPDFLDAYAGAIVEGIREFLRNRANTGGS